MSEVIVNEISQNVVEVNIPGPQGPGYSQDVIDSVFEARDQAQAAASDAVSQGEVPIRNNLSTAASEPVKDGIAKLIVLGDGGGSFTTVPNGTPAVFVSAAGGGASAKTFYREIIKGANYRKGVVRSLALQFPGNAAALAAFGGTSLYPQGHTYDEGGWHYTNYSGATARNIIVVRDPDGVYVGWFAIPAGGESIAARGSLGAGTAKLYSAPSATRNLVEYAIGTMPANGADVAISATRIATGDVGFQFAYGDGVWIAEQYSVDTGVERSRTAWKVYNDNFQLTGRFFVSKAIVGFMTDTFVNYPYIPKAQGPAIANGKIYFAIGGSYIPETAGPVSPRVADFGIVELNFDGSLSRYGVLQADKLIPRLVSMGYDVLRTESEGLARHPSGEIHNLFIGKRPSSAGVTTDGMLLMREFDAAGADFSDIRSPYSPFAVSRLVDGHWPRSSEGMLHPARLTALTGLSDLLDFMVEFQLPSAQWFHTSTTMPLDASGLEQVIADGNRRIELYNLNNSTFHLRTIGTGVLLESVFRLTKSGSTWTATPIGLDAGTRLRLKRPTDNIIFEISISSTGTLVPAQV